MRLFDTRVQELKYRALREVARCAFEDRMNDCQKIPGLVINGTEPTMRCCVYKERAIFGERVYLAMGGDKTQKNVISVLDIACDECPVSSYQVSDACRGCIAHRCEAACPRGAITFDATQKAHIDPNKCVSCGRCAQVCPYHAISNHLRPCETACKVKAISMGEDRKAHIDDEKCISCGACVYQCPFGAISDKSFIVDAVNLIKGSAGGKNYKLYAVVAPSISSQFSYAKLGQVITGIKRLGFSSVVEAALGADMVSWTEAQELAEKKMLTSSCCPAFVYFIRKQFPKMAHLISHNLSPMAAISKYIKENEPSSKIIFIGPCTAKKMEFQQEDVRPYVDCVLTFEELQALFDSRDMELSVLEESILDNASYYGRIFARCGGLSDAVAESLKEQGIDFDVKAISCDGIEACRMALLKASKGVLPENFIEGMVCNGGCIGGAGCLTHGAKDKNEVDKYGHEAFEKTISDAVGILGMN